MSPTREAAEVKWLAQLASMRDAVAELKLDENYRKKEEYGYGLFLDEEDFSGGSGGDDVWDIDSEEDDDDVDDGYSTNLPDSLRNHDDSNAAEDGSYGKNWLRKSCVAFALRKSGLNANEMEDQIMALLASGNQGAVIPIPRTLTLNQFRR